MDDRLRQAWRRCGASLSDDGLRPLQFGDAAAELEAGLERAVLADGSSLARLVAGGPDFLGLMQRLSTGDVAALDEGQGRPTVLTTAKGRIVERLFLHHLGGDGVLVVGGAGSGPRVLEHVGRFTFAEDVRLAESTSETFQFLIAGPRAADALEASGLVRPASFRCSRGALGGIDVRVLGEDGLSGNGFSVVGPTPSAARVWDELAEAVVRVGGRPAGDEPFEARRVLLGLPASGHELTEEANPLEAGLWEAVSFDKGCYVGQEVVARLRTYDKVASSLVGLLLPADRALPRVGSPLWDGDGRVGRVTSVVRPPGRPGPIGLGFVKRKSLRPGLMLGIGDEAGEPEAGVVDLPFPT